MSVEIGVSLSCIPNDSNKDVDYFLKLYGTITTGGLVCPNYLFLMGDVQLKVGTYYNNLVIGLCDSNQLNDIGYFCWWK